MPAFLPLPGTTDHRPVCICIYTIALCSFFQSQSQTKSKYQNISRSNSVHLDTMAVTNQTQFEDYLPLMAEKLGGEGLIEELCNGFRLLMDADKGMITFDSLKRNSSLLGLGDLSDDDVLCMLREGDIDGDGGLNQIEFCVLMFRLSPNLMAQSEHLLQEALEQEISGLHDS